MKKLVGLTLILLSVVLFSCQNENSVPENLNDEVLAEKSAQISLNEAEMESASLEVNYEVDFYANAEIYLTNWLKMGNHWKWTKGLRYKMNQCPTIQIESEEGGYPKTITLDYGGSTVLKNGKALSGVIIVEISGPRASVDYRRLITYQDFGVDSMLVNGTASVTIARGEEVFRAFESEMTFILADGTTIERKSQRNWEWIEGLDTELDQTDDVIQITGYTEATTSGGNSYRKEIVEPLIRTRDCRYIAQGVVEITLNGALVSSLDYGEGECDTTAIFTQNGEILEIDLSMRKYWCINNK